MRKLLAASALLAALTAVASAQAPPTSPGFQSSLLGKPADWPGNAGDLFKAHYDYPAALPAAAAPAPPWLTLNPSNASDRAAYYDGVKAYALTAFQGGILNGCPKTADGWYHAPWLTFTFGASMQDLAAGRIGSGREPICGLTQERAAPIGFLHKNQTKKVESWAVGMFNAPGGFLLGRIWRNRDAVDLSETKFPNGTFVAKFLFTEADSTLVPYLAGTPAWQANVYKTDGSTVRQTKTMHLIQIDFGIRDSHQDATTGWVYGTFLYFNPTPGTTPTDWTKNLIPVGSMWGNDHGKKKLADYVEESLNPAVAQLRDDGKLFDPAKRKTFGYFDRVNGPLDNPQSACLSCHATAQVHKTVAIKHFILPALVASKNTDTNRMLWFRDIKAGTPFTFTAQQLKLVDQGSASTVRADWTVALMKDFVSTDYSLQLRLAIENARSFTVQSAIATLQSMAPAHAMVSSGLMQKMVRDSKIESLRIERAGEGR